MPQFSYAAFILIVKAYFWGFVWEKSDFYGKILISLQNKACSDNKIETKDMKIKHMICK